MAEDNKKPLEKMTVKELKEVALEIPEITGVHGMNKSDLLGAIKEAKGIVDTVKKRSGSVREVKKKIKAVCIGVCFCVDGLGVVGCVYPS